MGKKGYSIVRIVVLIVNEIEINLKFDAQAAIMFCSHFERQPTKTKVKKKPNSNYNNNNNSNNNKLEQLSACR